MSINSLQSTINRLQGEIADLYKKISNEKKKEADATTKIIRAQQSIAKSSSQATIRSKLSEIDRNNNDVARSSKNQADLQRKVADKSKDLIRYQQQLSKAIETENKKQLEAQRNMEQRLLASQQDLAKELEDQKGLIREGGLVSSRLASTASAEDYAEPEYDVFISHASEDKDDFVRPLAEELVGIGVKVWYDEHSMRWGDSLRQSIDKGLANSRFGIIVISTHFVNKPWPAYELDGLIAREIEGGKVVLPIWHKVSKSEVMKFSPTMANKIALNSSIDEISDIAKQLKEMLQ